MVYSVAIINQDNCDTKYFTIRSVNSFNLYEVVKIGRNKIYKLTSNVKSNNLKYGYISKILD